MDDNVNTLTELLRVRAKETPMKTAYFVARDDHVSPSFSWSEIEIQATTFAHNLHALSPELTKGFRIAIDLPNEPIWEIVSFGARLLGGCVLGITSLDTQETICHMLTDGEISVLVTKNCELLKILGESRCNALSLIIVLEETSELEELQLPHVVSFESLQKTDSTNHDKPLPAIYGEDAADLIYTSGTTGTPRGIVYSHAQIVTAMTALAESFRSVAPEPRVVCWLPLSFLFQRMVNLCTTAVGGQIYFVSKPREIMHYLPLIRPDVLIGVPRFFEKLYEGIQERLEEAPKPVQLLLHRAVQARTKLLKKQSTRTLSDHLLSPIASWILARRLAKALGGPIPCLLSGSAPCPTWLVWYFHALGMPIMEGYGVSENSVPVAVNSPGQYRPGSVGKPLSPNQVTLAADGEVLVRGPGVFSGYLNQANEEESITTDGYYRTGDYGELDYDGYLYLNGRKSRLIKTSSGKRVQPRPLEEALTQLPFIDYAYVTGDNRKCLVAILSLKSDKLDSLVSTEEGNLEQNTTLLQKLSKSIRAQLGNKPGSELIAGAIVTEREFSIAGGELTASLKVRPSKLEHAYRNELDSLYQRLDSSHLASEPRNLILLVANS